MTQPVDLVLVGAGSRGTHAYGAWALREPGLARFVAVAEPIAARRETFARAHGIPPERRFADWHELFAQRQLAAAAVISTPDRDHVLPTIAAMETGYDVLLEKPIAPTLPESVRVVHAAKRTGKALAIAHVLRYTPFFSRLHDILKSGRIGEIVAVAHRENISYWHMAHSFVRGHWRRRDEASPLILAKCCHDLDILLWNVQRPFQRVTSTGGLSLYRRENAPEGSTMRCTEGCTIERTCPHSALRIYLDLAPFRDWNLDPAWPDVWPINVITDDLTRAGRQSALARGPWGRCVYRCDNDVVDHQQVTLDIEDGGVATLTVVGHSAREGRSLRYDGTHGTVRGRFASANAELEICAHGGACETIRFDTHHDDHGGGDEGLMRAFVAALRGGPPLAGAQELLESHLLAFAADRARLSRESVDLPTFRAEAETAPAK